MRRVSLGELRRGDLILVRWIDASDVKAPLREHEARPEVYVKDWGVYLGVSGRRRRMMLLGKDVVEAQGEWGATRIPLELIEEIILLMPREETSKVIREVLSITRRVRLRRFQYRNSDWVRLYARLVEEDVDEA